MRAPVPGRAHLRGGRTRPCLLPWPPACSPSDLAARRRQAPDLVAYLQQALGRSCTRHTSALGQPPPRHPARRPPARHRRPPKAPAGPQQTRGPRSRRTPRLSTPAEPPVAPNPCVGRRSDCSDSDCESISPVPQPSYLDAVSWGSPAWRAFPDRAGPSSHPGTQVIEEQPVEAVQISAVARPPGTKRRRRRRGNRAIGRGRGANTAPRANQEHVPVHLRLGNRVDGGSQSGDERVPTYLRLGHRVPPRCRRWISAPDANGWQEVLSRNPIGQRNAAATRAPRPHRRRRLPDALRDRNYYSPGSGTLYFDRRSLGVKPMEVVFDSGSTYTYFTAQPYQAVVSALKGGLSKSLKQVSDPSLPLCWKGPKAFKSVFDVKKEFKSLFLSFASAKNAVMEIPPENYLIVTKNGNVCLGILDGTAAKLSFNVIGDITMQDQMVIYDNEKSQLGWARGACTRSAKSILSSFP
ncbi:uncharacterized protein [Miscanthus floridulus]|uniref:uncharacterized protein isoform X1 n=1 Tax=Miscanthus floridulus TaxID=154761 RepID=UPI00345959D5